MKVLQYLKLKMTSGQNALERTGPKRTMFAKEPVPKEQERKKKV